jgi:deoxycytidylate deaminase
MQTTGDGRPELIFGLLGPAGIRLEDLAVALKDSLASFGYASEEIRMSALLKNCANWTEQLGATEFDRITHLQAIGYAFRKRLQDGAALARAAITEIRKRRMSFSGNPDRPASAVAYVLNQLKHPDEVDLLRRVYGPSFILVAGHAPRAIRVTDLSKRMARLNDQRSQNDRFESKASEVITSDDKQEDDFGQNTRDAYPKADFFANLGVPLGHSEVQRFIDLMFGHPSHTPSPDEYAMYQASAVALRSSDDSRQVGAVIASLTRDSSDKIKNTDIIAVGMNEVPRGGGGFYWDKDSPDHRDQALLLQGEDRAFEIKISTLTEMMERIKKKGWLDESLASLTTNDLARKLLPDLKRTQFLDIGEFSRPVHAEMAALIDAARRGVAVDGQSIYVTTYPCHNCAKHIIAAGIKRVVYLEPYSKSRTRDLYGEEIIQESADGKDEDGKVVFFGFSGVAPRQYRQLFSMSERGAQRGNSLTKWFSEKKTLSPKYLIGSAALAYVAEERRELAPLEPLVYNWDRETVLPD